MLPPATSGARRLIAVGGAALMVLAILVGGLMVCASRQIDPSCDPGELVTEQAWQILFWHAGSEVAHDDVDLAPGVLVRVEREAQLQRERADDRE